MCCSARAVTGAAIMASFNVSGMDELQAAFGRIENIPWEVTEKALGKMADVAAAKVKAQGENMGVRDAESAEHILDRIKPAKAKQDDSGGHQDITFSGSRMRNGIRTRNAEIAFVQEYGKRGQQARPFIGTAMASNDETIAESGAEVIGDWIENEFNQ